jgi:hypothetical protein
MKQFGIVALTAFAVLIGETAHAAEPAWWTQQKRQCGLPPSLPYNTWAAQGYPCGGGAAQPAPDPRAALHNRVSAVISANSDLVDGSALARTNLWDDNAFAGLIAGVRRDLWRASSGFDALTADRRWVMSYYAPHLARLEEYASTLNAAGYVPRNLVDAHDQAQAAAANARAEVDRINTQAIHEQLGTVFSAALWESQRNEALAQVRARFPQADGLPAPTDENARGDIGERMHLPPGPFRVLELPPGPSTPMPGLMGVLAPDWNPDGLSYRHATPSPEPPAPATLAERVSELERMAGEARAAKARANVAAQQLSALEDRYRSYYDIDEKGQAAIARANSETDLAKSQVRWLAEVRKNEMVKVRKAIWQRVYATSKGLVWQAMNNQVVPDALRAMADAAPVEKARKYKALVDQILSLEGDFELYSSQAAEVLAHGSPAEARHVLEAVYGTWEGDGRETMRKAFDAANAPESLREVWRRLLGDAP